MKLPFVEALETLDTGQRIPITKRVTIERQVGIKPAFARDEGIEYLTTAKFTIRQYISEPGVGAIDVLRRQAARALMHEVYGPIEQRLIEILIMLQADGPLYDDKIRQEVEDLLNDMRPFK